VRTLSRYLLKRFLSSFLGTLLVLILVVTIAETLINLDDLITDAGGWSGAAIRLGLRIPAYYLRILVPMAGFISTLFALGTTARANEMIAIKSGGISPLRAIAPILACAALLSVAALLLYETAGVEASRDLHEVLHGDDRMSFEHESFWFQKDGAIFNMRDADFSARRLEGVQIFYRGENGLPVRSLAAVTAQLEDEGRWRLSDVIVRHFDRTQPNAAPRLEHLEEMIIQGSARHSLARFDATLTTSSLRQLRKIIRIRTRDGADPRDLRAQLHERYSAPFVLLIFVLIATPLGLRVEQTKSLATPALQGVLMVALFWILHSLSGSPATRGVIDAPTYYWGLTLLFGAFASWRVAQLRH